MAKAAKKTASAPARSSAPAPSRNVPAVQKGGKEVAPNDLMSMMEQDAGRGVSTAVEDNVVPLVYILQALSPQVIRGNPKQVKGAKPGDIWLRGTTIVFDGEEGFLAQPCHFSKGWIEWMPERGGFVARHPSRPPEAVQKEHPKNKDQKIWVMPNDNIVAESREHVVIIHHPKLARPTPFVIPMSGSQHTSSRNWMGLMNNNFIPGTDKTAPSWGYLYRMTIESRTKDDYNWFGWEITHGKDGDEGTEPLALTDEYEAADALGYYKMGRKIADDFDAGTLRAGEADADLEDGKPAQNDSEHL